MRHDRHTMALVFSLFKIYVARSQWTRNATKTYELTAKEIHERHCGHIASNVPHASSHIVKSFPAEEFQGSAINDSVHPTDFDTLSELEPKIQPTEEQNCHGLDDAGHNRRRIGT